MLARFFDRQSFGQIARELGISENAAQHRAERALDRLRAALARRQITSTTAALGLALTGQPAMAAPVGLAATITQSAVAGITLGATSAGGGLIAFMTTTKAILDLGSGAAALGLATLYLGTGSAADAQRALAIAQQRENVLAKRVEAATALAQAETQRTLTAERKNQELLDAARTQTATSTEPEITAALVNQRLRAAEELVRSGDPALALRELIWCYDVGLPRIGKTDVSRSGQLRLFAELGERHPPALAWLRERRERMRAGTTMENRSDDEITEYAFLNHALQDPAASVALLDALPPEDRRRQRVAIPIYENLVELRRYRDAAAGLSYPLMSADFERRKARPGRDQLVATTARNIEVLAGAGELTRARELAKRLLQAEPSAETRATIQQHAARAGHPTLLAPTSAP